MLVAPAAELDEEAVVGGDESHVRSYRLDEHRRHLVAVPREHLVDRSRVVVRRDHRVGDGALGDARAPGQSECRDAAARRDEQGVDMTVVAPGELDDLRPARGATRQPHGGHGRFGARRDEAHLLDRRHARADRLGQLDLAGGRHAVRRPVGGGALDGFDHLRMRMPEDRRPPRLHVVDVPSPVGIDEVRALTAGDEERLSADGAEGAHRGAHAAGDARQRPVEERLQVSRGAARRLRAPGTSARSRRRPA